MSSRASIALALLLACTPDQPTTPPEKWPDIKVGGASTVAEALPAPHQQQPKADTTVATPSQPAHAGDPLEALAPTRSRPGLPGPRSAGTSGCEGGQRGVGDTWKVECNECSCGDDGQVTCTAMACGYH